VRSSLPGAARAATPAFVDFDRAAAETEGLADQHKVVESQPAQQSPQQTRNLWWLLIHLTLAVLFIEGGDPAHG